MRIAVVTHSERKIGGIETHLDTAIPALAAFGNDVALWHETDRPKYRDLISVPDGAPIWCTRKLGLTEAFRGLEKWRPDILYVHGLEDPALESKLTSLAPSVFFAHQYHGTCISGSKTWKQPQVVPCRRRFGWPCLLHYYPHRCGGWNPLTMAVMYGVQSQRCRTLAKYSAVVTHTEHMRNEYAKHCLQSTKVRKVAFPVKDLTGECSSASAPTNPQEEPSSLLFVGRMDRLKGGLVLLEAAQKASANLGRPLSITFTGDGPDRSAWERAARENEETGSGVRCSFIGWKNGQELADVFQNASLLVMPSLWPEPFGMVGIEAGHFGVPSVAFDVGGISEWLQEGRNGALAPGDPPTSDGLAQAIAFCLRNSERFAKLSEGAKEAANRFSVDRHIEDLMAVFEEVKKR